AAASRASNSSINDTIDAPYFTRHSRRTPTPPTPSTSVLPAQGFPTGEPHPTAIRIANVLVVVSGSPGVVDAHLAKAVDKVQRTR
ncbi:hypothetical protein ACPCUU_51210, partial [Streptomyces umbrinus]